MDTYALIDLALKRYSPTEIARELGVDPKTVRHWKIRETEPPAYVADAIRQRLLPLGEAPTEPGAFKFIDLFAGIGGLRTPFKSLAAGVYSPANGTPTHRRLTRQTSMTAPAMSLRVTLHRCMKMMCRIMMCCLLVSPASPSRLPGSPKRTRSAAPTASPTNAGHTVFRRGPDHCDQASKGILAGKRQEPGGP